MASHKKTLSKNEDYRFDDRGPKLRNMAAVAGGGFLSLTVLLGLLNKDSMARFFNSYLVALMFFMSIALGALFFVILQHLVRAQWSVTVRRVAELLTYSFPVLGVLMLGGIVAPMLLGNDALYPWSKSNLPHGLHSKQGYLNETFFALRVVIYFTYLILVSRYFAGRSIAQDESGDEAISERLRVVSAPAIIGFAFVVAFIGFDLLMSLDPFWFSTMFGVYFFAGCAMSIMAVLSVLPQLLQRWGKIKTAVNVEHYHDTGKLMFAFVFFWSYVAFSQFMLIWYANMPEETTWYQHRMFTSWKYVSILLLVGHFAFPFLCLLSRWTKRKLHYLTFFSIWMLAMQYVDLYWLVLPEAHKSGINFGALGLLMDVAALIGIGGLFIAAVAHKATTTNLLPIKDPKLGEALAFENY